MSSKGKMTTRSVKFEITLEKLSVKFEGDLHFAEKVQADITGALNTLASAQQRMIGPAKPASSAPPPAPSRKSSSRKRRQSTNGGIDPAIVDGLPEAENNGNSDAASVIEVNPPRLKRSGSGARDLITSLKDEGLFSERQTNASIRAALAKKGHTFQSNEINPVLVRLTRQNILKRDKHGEQWVYFSE
jgi:hypothetical protein